MVKRSSKTIAGMLPVMAAIAGWLILTRPWETPTERAYRVCRACGLDDAEIEWLIDAKRHTTPTREQELELFYATFERKADAELCEPCAEAVLDAAVLRER